MKPLLIGIAGPSAAGKSSTSRQLKRRLKNATIISVDHYWKDPVSFPPVTGEHGLEGWRHWELPQNIDFDLLHKNLTALKRGEETMVPIRTPDPVHNIISMHPVRPTETIIVEGMLLFYEARIRELFDMCIYLDIPEDISVRRRLRRNRAGGEGGERYIRRVTLPSFRKYGKPTMQFAHAVIDTTKPLHATVSTIVRRIRALFAQTVRAQTSRARTQHAASKRERPGQNGRAPARRSDRPLPSNYKR